MLQKFFKVPFAQSGDKTAIPDAAQPGGEVSYEEGWTPDYDLEIGVDPSSKPIDRAKHNGLFEDITDNIKQYQTFGVPEWITSADNDGTPYPYEQFARVKYTDGNVYVSLVASNTEEPTTGDQWEIFSTNPGAIPIGGTLWWCQPNPPAGAFLYDDGAAYSRATYSRLFAITGVAWGAGDGVTTFNVNDTRGYFPRVQDNGAGIDPDAATRTARPDGVSGDNPGTTQDGEVEDHNHPTYRGIAPGNASTGGGGFDNWLFDGVTGSTGGAETRGINMYWQTYTRYA